MEQDDLLEALFIENLVNLALSTDDEERKLKIMRKVQEKIAKLMTLISLESSLRL